MQGPTRRRGRQGPRSLRGFVWSSCVSLCTVIQYCRSDRLFAAPIEALQPTHERGRCLFAREHTSIKNPPRAVGLVPSRREVPMSLKPDVHQNRLLAALPAAEFGRLSPHLELLALPAGEMLSEAASEAAYVYFPATAVVCLLCLMESGMSTGLAIVGNDGMVDV